MLSNFPGRPYKDIFDNSSAAMLIIGVDAPAYTMLDVNQAYLTTTNTRREDLIGRSVFGVFPGNPTDNDSKNIERTQNSFAQAIKSKVPHVMSNYRYDIPIPGTDEFEERYWSTSNTPVMNEEGEVIYFIHSPANVTELNKLAIKERAGVAALKKSEEQLYSTFMQAPVGIIILKGDDFMVDLVNPSICELYGKTQQDMIGKPIFDVLIHTRGQGFEELLNNVRLTGIPYRGDGVEIWLDRKSKLEKVYVNFVYEPFRDTDGSITGVIAVAVEVTDLVSAKKQIEEAEERARLAIDAVDLGTFDLDLITSEMITSVQFANIFGFEKPVARSEYVSVFHPDDLALRAVAHENAIATGKLLYDSRVIWKDRSVHWVRVEGKTFYNTDKKAIRILGTLLDITEQRKAKEEERKLISLVENSVDMMSILNLEGINSYINEAGMKMLGFDNMEEVRSVPIVQLHTPEDFEFVQREVLPAVSKDGRWAGTMMVRHLKTGEVFPVFNNCFRIADPVSGVPIAVGAVMRDMRPELAAKQALADSELLLRNITSAAPTALWMSDENGDIIYVNQTWIDWTGRPFNENLGADWLTKFVDADKEKVSAKFSNCISTHQYYEAEFRLHHSDGTIHWCAVNGRPQYKQNGDFSGYIGACVDITEQKLMQQQKDDFIGIASHELKTPITSIKGYTQVLEKMLITKGQTTEAAMMGRMNSQINRLTSLVGDLLDVTKINSGKLQFNDQEFDFNNMVKERVEDLKHMTEKHQLIEEYQITGMVYGDKDRIGQVISNLITNAIKYSPNADKIIIRTSIKDKQVSLCVQDFGIGIPEDKLNKVFEQFYRVSGDMQHTFPGLGLGLYISSEIIKRENGKIWVTSDPGKGSTFCFALPVSQEDNIIDR
ncbi:MAG: PAS domain S-box protein [Ferruginibacter sp.]